MRGSGNFVAIRSAQPLSKKQWAEQSLQCPNGLICPDKVVQLQQKPIKGVKSLLGRLFTPGSASVSAGFVAVRRAKSIDVYVHERCVDALAAYGLAARSIGLDSEELEVNVHKSTAQFVSAYQQAYGDKRKVITRHEVTLRTKTAVATPIVDGVLVTHSVNQRPKQKAEKSKVVAAPLASAVAKPQSVVCRHGHRAVAVFAWPKVPTERLPVVQGVRITREVQSKPKAEPSKRLVGL